MAIKPGNLFVFPKAKVLSRQQDQNRRQTVLLRIDGMVCALCASRVKRALLGLKGVQRAEVSLKRGEATVQTLKTVPSRLLEQAVQGQVILSWARGALARLPFLGRRTP